MDVVVIRDGVVGGRFRPGREAVQAGHRLPDQVGDGDGFLRGAGDEPELARPNLPDGVDEALRHVGVLPRRAGADGEDEEGRHGQ